MLRPDKKQSLKPCTLINNIKNIAQLRAVIYTELFCKEPKEVVGQLNRFE